MTNARARHRSGVQSNCTYGPESTEESTGHIRYYL